MRLGVRDLTLLAVFAYLLVPQAKCSLSLMEDAWRGAASALAAVRAPLETLEDLVKIRPAKGPRS